MSGVQIDNSPAVATRSRDISSWKDADISALTTSEKKRYYRRKSAVKAYFTTDEPLDRIALRYHLPARMLEKLVKRCTMQHEDSEPWGFRALVPGVQVLNHAPAHVSETASVEAKREVEDHESNKASAVTCSESPQEEHASLSADAESALREDIVGDDSEDTAQRQAIVLASDTLASSDELPDITGIDESSLSSLPDEGEGNANTAEEKLSPGTENEEISFEENGKSAREGAYSEVIVAQAASPVIPVTPIPDIGDISPLSDGERDEKDTPGETQAIQAPSQIIPATPAPAIEDISTPSESEGNDDSTIVLEETALAEPEKLVEPIIVDSELVPPDGVTERIREKTQESGPFYMPELPRKTSRSLVVRGQVLPATLLGTSKKQAAVSPKKTVVAQRSIRKRWVRNVEHRRKRRSNRMISAIVVAVLFLSLLIPVGAGIAAYSAYNSIKGIALDGVNHLMSIKTLMPASKSDYTAVLNPVKLQQANADLTQAQNDFLQLQELVNRQDIQSLVQQFAPQYSNKLGMAQHLVQVGIDVTHMGTELISVGLLAANILHGPLLAAGATTPLITTSDISTIEGTMLHALYYISDIKTQMSQVSLNQLPISASQQKQIASAMALLPKAQSYIEQGQGVIGIVSWLLGVGQQRRFLVQTMDRAELRPSGGFTGQYGIFTIQDGRMAPFTLQDVTELDYNGNGAAMGRQAPPGYTSWMNFGNFGLRDANLSGDFPTTARIAMQVFQEEGGGPVDGDIMFTPTAIEHVLDVIGPLKIPSYNETITAQNLEDRLHYYQNNANAIELQKEKTNTHNAATRKTFTALVGSTLLATVRHLPVKTLLKVAQNAQKDIASRDLEIYFANPQAEAWLVTHNFSGAMNTFSNVDGFMVVQSNISISKASDDVQTTEQDQITLDPQGGATHNLTITLDYRGTKPIYSVYTTYADYIRVYAPANAVLQSGYGFDTGKALCTPTPVVPTTGTGGTKPPSPTGSGTPTPPTCSQLAQSYSNGALYCPNGNYSMGARGWFGNKYSNWAIDKLGEPTELTSDLPGRAMWGGLTVTPQNCILTITLSWYVPNVVKHVAGQPLYSVLVQKQGGYVPTVQISIDTSQLKGVKPYSFNGDIYADRLFSLAILKKGH